jgi:polar amino acid transport system substrate-binding protein
VNDFKSLKIFGKTNKEIKHAQDKGHKSEVEAFMNAVKKGNPSPIPFNEIYLTTLATLKVVESIACGGGAISLQQ